MFIAHQPGGAVDLQEEVDGSGPGRGEEGEERGRRRRRGRSVGSLIQYHYATTLVLTVVAGAYIGS